MTLHHLDALAAMSSTKDKEAYLAAHLEDDLFRYVVVAALDPFRTYGIVPPLDEESPAPAETDDWDEMFSTLLDFADRELTGRAAAEAVADLRTVLTPAGNQILNRILNKDLRCGVGIKLVNAARKGTVPVFELMLAHKFEPKRVKTFPVDTQPKLDGVRVACCITEDSVTFYTRNGKPVKTLEHVAAQLRTRKWPWPVTWLDGEVTNGSHFNETGALRRKSQQAEGAIYTVFEMLPTVGGKSEYNHALRLDRMHSLMPLDLPNVVVVPTRQAFSLDEIMAHYEEARAAGLEGIIVKPWEGHYEPKRSYAWLKIKPEETVDLEVVGVFEGEPGTKYAGQLGGIIVDHKGVQVRVGSGFSDADRVALWAAPPIGRIAEVQYHEVTPDGSLRHPRLLRWRDDL